MLAFISRWLPGYAEQVEFVEVRRRPAPCLLLLAVGSCMVGAAWLLVGNLAQYPVPDPVRSMLRPYSSHPPQVGTPLTWQKFTAWKDGTIYGAPATGACQYPREGGTSS